MSNRGPGIPLWAIMLVLAIAVVAALWVAIAVTTEVTPR